MPRYAMDEPVPAPHPMVEDAMDSAKGVEMDLTNVTENWRGRRQEMARLRDAHLKCAELLDSAINRVDFFLREDTAQVNKEAPKPMSSSYEH